MLKGYLSPEMEQLSAKGTGADMWSAGVAFGALLSVTMSGLDGFGTCEVEPCYVIETCLRNLAQLMLEPNQFQRITAEDALKDPFFVNKL